MKKSTYECHLSIKVKKNYYVFKQNDLYEPYVPYKQIHRQRSHQHDKV